MNLDDPDELKKSKKYHKFQSELQSCLLKVERTTLSDWAGLNNGLVQLQRVIDSSAYNELPIVPERLLLCRVLGKCLDPMAAMGVHRKAVETLMKICTKLGPNGIAACLPLLTANVLHLLPCAATQTRPDILTLMEQHFLTLPLESLALCFPGVLASVAPSLEESDTSELYRRVLTILQTTLKAFEDRNIAHLYYHALWSTVRNASSARVGALMFLRMTLKKAEPLPPVEDQLKTPEFEYARPSVLADVSLASNDTPLVVEGLCAALADRSDKALRLALDLLVFHFPLHEDGVLTFQETVTLMTAALRVLVTNPQNATLRRVFMWIYGGNEINAVYFKRVSFRFVAQALTNMFAVAEDNSVAEVPQCDTMFAFEALLSLFSRPEGEEHFLDLVPEVISSVCTAVQWYYKNGAWGSTTSSTQKIFRLLDCLPWSHFLQYVQNCADEVQALVEKGASGDELAAQLKTMLDILDATRLHYISLTTSTTYLPQLRALCLQLCTTVEMLASRCDAAIASVALEVFHVAYFGVARGLLSHGESAPASTAALQDHDDVCNQMDTEVVVVTVDLQVVVRAFSKTFAVVCDVLSGSLPTRGGGAALGADDLFSTSSIPTGRGDKDMIKLFADLCETQLSLLSQDRSTKSPQGSAERQDAWLVSAERVVYACGTHVAVCAASLVLETYCNDALTEGELMLLRGGSMRKLLGFLWALFTAANSEHHVQLTKTFAKLDRRAETHAILSEMMEAVHPANCRQFYALFRLVADQGSSDFPFRAGLLMMMRAMSSAEPNTRLIASGFVEQSLPYFNRITEPLLCRLLERLSEAKDSVQCVEHTSALIDTIALLLNSPLVTATGASVVQRLWALPQPSFSKQLVDAVDFSRFVEGTPMLPAEELRVGDNTRQPRGLFKDPLRVGADNDMIVNNTFSLLLYIALQTIRHELRKHHGLAVLMNGSLASPGTGLRSDQSLDEGMLSSLSVPNITQGEESSHAVRGLAFVLDALRLSTSFSDPPETVANMCTHFAVASMELLNLCICSRLPMMQLQLLDIYQTCVTFLEASGRSPTGGGRRLRGQSESSAGDENTKPSDAPETRMEALSVSPPTTLALRPSSKSKRLLKPLAEQESNAPCGTPVLTKGTMRIMRQGLVAAVLTELHPVMSCYGLFNRWRSFTAAMLPLFHELLHDAVYEVIATHVMIIRCVRDRPLAPTSGYLLQRSLQSLIDLVQFLFRPSTRMAEGGGSTAGEAGGSRKLESVTQLPMWLLQQGLGGAAHSQQDAGGASNYDLAVKELVVCLEALLPACLETFLSIRRTSMQSIDSRNRDSAASLQTARLQVEAPIKVLLEVLLKETELEAFERLIWLWGKRTTASTTTSANGLLHIAEGSDDTLIAELLSSSAGVTPASVVCVCDQLLQRHRRGTMKAGVQSRSLSGDLAFDVSVFHFLHAFFFKCRGADRFDRILTPLMDAVVAHLAAWGSPLVSPLALPMLLRLLATIGKRYATANTPLNSSSGISSVSADALLRNERRGPTIFQKVLDALSTTGSALTDVNDEVTPLALRLVADVLADYSAAFISRDQVDRVGETVGGLYSRVLGPAISASMNTKGGYEKILQLAPRVQTALAVITAFLGGAAPEATMVPRKLKNELIDVLFSPSFFKMTRQSVAQWRTIFERLTADRSINGAILQRFNAPPTAQSMLTAIVQSQEDEASNRGRFLKRLAFYVFCVTNTDREFINGVREKISETFRQFGRHNKLVPVRYALFVFRVLMTRIPPQLLTPFWPVILPELIRWLNQKPTGDDDFYLAMEALKVIDFAICVLPAEFQVFRWVFFDDSKAVEELYRGSAANLRSAHLFVPLIRSLSSDIDSGSRRPRDFTTVRHEAYPLKPQSLTLDGHVPHRPLLAVPERCYFDLKGIEVVSSLLQRASNCTAECIAAPAELRRVELEDTNVVASTEEMGLVRRGDHYDVAYVDWLLEAEFMHVGVAASEQKLIAQKSMADCRMEEKTILIGSSPQTSALRPGRHLEESPERGGDEDPGVTTPQAPEPTAEFVDVGDGDTE